MIQGKKGTDDLVFILIALAVYRSFETPAGGRCLMNFAFPSPPPPFYCFCPLILGHFLDV
jgi:hypothetical protein